MCEKLGRLAGGLSGPCDLGGPSSGAVVSFYIGKCRTKDSDGEAGKIQMERRETPSGPRTGRGTTMVHFHDCSTSYNSSLHVHRLLLLGERNKQTGPETLFFCKTTTVPLQKLKTSVIGMKNSAPYL